MGELFLQKTEINLPVDRIIRNLGLIHDLHFQNIVSFKRATLDAVVPVHVKKTVVVNFKYGTQDFWILH